MPVLTEAKTVLVPVGMICDCCGKEDDVGFNTFTIDHTLGYESPMDTTKISAAICDGCLLGIMLDKVPNAVFQSSDGSPVSREAAAQALEQYRSRLARLA